MRFQYLLSLLGLALIALGTIEGRWLILALWLGSNFLVLGIANSGAASSRGWT
jgi:hypothetical protein